MRKRIYLIISLLLCVLMVFSVFTLTSCDSNGADVETEETEECKSVVRIKKSVPSGKQIGGENLEVVEIPAADVPEGAIASIDDIVGKYATIDMVLGEYVFERMLTTEAPKIDENLLTYIVVSDKIENAYGKDITAELQALIDTYPGKTIYFNDGTYTISSTIYIPTEKEKAVSIRLSNYATIKAAEGWKNDTPMIAIGAKSDAAKAERSVNSFSGGKLDGAGFAKIGLTVENCKSPFISNVTLVNLQTSLTIKKTADVANVEALTVNGSGDNESIGILNESSSSVFSTINISNVNTGVKNNGADNDFRNVTVKCTKALETSVGFYECGSNNVFEFCTSEDFTTGYAINDGVKSVFEGCNAYWTSASAKTQNAFVAEGKFNSVISAGTARFFDASSMNAYIKIINRGSGLIKTPIFDEALCDDQGYKSVLAGTVIPIK